MARRLYASSPVVDGLPLLAEPEFWAAHLADLYDGALVESFGVDVADVEVMLDRLADKAAWPMFRIPLAGGHTVLVHYNNGEEYTSTDFFLVHPAWRANELVLASTDADRIGPGLCWAELAALLDAPGDGEGVTDPHARLLLLLPVLGDTNVPAGAVTRVQEALVAQGAAHACEPLARRLLKGHPMWGAAPWSYDGDERAWICEGAHSPRKTPLGDHLPASHRTALEDCLTPWEA
ncbi:hypothetical protein [Streptomyces sp. SP18CS02]|uniref:hypothetical protein n=1 Tax=Streptomyces sp. SP18CS02 TaxID=3002531 RepID=UPI002E793A02|nr:hypothetical protein [Streptomyces sp. SP18CS02]MEE1752788.1 hypothetical protein [Streptomyces sp. SP18CS02]